MCKRSYSDPAAHSFFFILLKTGIMYTSAERLSLHMGWGTIFLDISRNKKGTSLNIYCIFPKELCSTYLKFKENPMFKIRYSDPAAHSFCFLLLKTGIMYTSTDRLNLHMWWGTILIDISRNRNGASLKIFIMLPKV